VALHPADGFDTRNGRRAAATRGVSSTASTPGAPASPASALQAVRVPDRLPRKAQDEHGPLFTAADDPRRLPPWRWRSPVRPLVAAENFDQGVQRTGEAPARPLALSLNVPDDPGGGDDRSEGGVVRMARPPVVGIEQPAAGRAVDIALGTFEVVPLEIASGPTRPSPIWGTHAWPRGHRRRRRTTPEKVLEAAAPPAAGGGLRAGLLPDAGSHGVNVPCATAPAPPSGRTASTAEFARQEPGTTGRRSRRPGFGRIHAPNYLGVAWGRVRQQPARLRLGAGSTLALADLGTDRPGGAGFLDKDRSLGDAPPGFVEEEIESDPRGLLARRSRLPRHTNEGDLPSTGRSPPSATSTRGDSIPGAGRVS